MFGSRISEVTCPLLCSVALRARVYVMLCLREKCCVRCAGEGHKLKNLNRKLKVEYFLFFLDLPELSYIFNRRSYIGQEVELSYKYDTYRTSGDPVIDCMTGISGFWLQKIKHVIG